MQRNGRGLAVLRKEFRASSSSAVLCSISVCIPFYAPLLFSFLSHLPAFITTLRFPTFSFPNPQMFPFPFAWRPLVPIPTLVFLPSPMRRHVLSLSILFSLRPNRLPSVFFCPVRGTFVPSETLTCLKCFRSLVSLSSRSNHFTAPPLRVFGPH